MPMFEIEVERTITDYCTVKVEADTIEEAEEIDINSDLEFDPYCEDNISYQTTRKL